MTCPLAARHLGKRDNLGLGHELEIHVESGMRGALRCVWRGTGLGITFSPAPVPNMRSGRSEVVGRQVPHFRSAGLGGNRLGGGSAPSVELGRPWVMTLWHYLLDASPRSRLVVRMVTES